MSFIDGLIVSRKLSTVEYKKQVVITKERTMEIKDERIERVMTMWT